MRGTRIAGLVTLAAISAAGVVASVSRGGDGPTATVEAGSGSNGRGDDSAATGAPDPDPDPGVDMGMGISSTTAAPSTTTTTATRGRRGSGEPVTLAFAGDVHFESYLRPQLDSDATGMLAPIAPVLSAADLAVVNLETAITERGTAEPKAYTFRAPQSAFVALRAAGIDVASMANNHGLDFGPVGFLDSIAAADAEGFPVIGIGGDDDTAYAPFTTTIRGQRIAVIGASHVIDSALMSSWVATDDHAGIASAYETERLLQAVRDARAESDTLVVFLHWGTERMICPQERQTTLARQLVDAGADVVVGGHAHRVQGAGRLDGALVAYGLGNFVWYAQPGASSETGVLLVTATGRDIDAYEWRPALIRNGVPNPLEGDEAAAALDHWNALRECTGLLP